MKSRFGSFAVVVIVLMLLMPVASFAGPTPQNAVCASPTVVLPGTSAMNNAGLWWLWFHIW